MKQIKLYTLSLFMAVLTLASCSEYTDGINDDPNAFTSAPAELLLGNAQLSIITLSESQAARVAGIFTDQFTGADRQFIPLNSYTTSNTDYDDIWSDLYVEGATQADLAIKKAAEEGNTVLEGVAEINLALLMGEAAALFGDVPFTEAFDAQAFPEPNFDAQADVLNSVQDLLTSGISKVGSTPVSIYGDLRFASNGATWAEVAHSLKARYYLVAKDYPSALAEARLGISSSNGDLVASHSSTVGAKNLFFVFTKVEREGYLTTEGSHLYNLVSGATPRLLATPGETQREAYYYADNVNPNTASGGVFAEDADFPIISYIETKLIEAEAAQRTGDDALTPFNAVRTELAGIYGGAFPATTSTGATLLEEILEEKYISLIGSLQVFHDVRRTNNLIGVPIKNADTPILPQRFLYPLNEINSNTNTPATSVGLYDTTQVNQ
ncbi:RagB/SusD family nutrient uptake outer membrane protein [Oceanihabitans sp. IOP_32]|uniref:SusD/RagB family nutrient-binding outer membrane lipoprotein n=1 Tax=Oceanihabitans sp. IOP_32 TaxID=2529032 RepID=UPI0012937DE2|nr:SusD/RagB family nutrient-binding outer membrane lipoprotein [Oceanihabitans sp. IOP_32]QFZ53872.1 RagB/SusD family nutrient uptake outer membrane protein [Oceanihabitans sp. IOP_32]